MDRGCSLKTIGILFQPKIKAAGDLARQLTKVVEELGFAVWTCSAWEEERAQSLLDGTKFVVCLGGDGTILRAARVASPLGIPILGVNLGWLGFMTEVGAQEALSRVPAFVGGEGWVEERAMLQAQVASSDGAPYHALNDAVVARGARCRLIRVRTTVDGQPLTTYKCDGVIVATATGSTGYSLAAGGPVLHPHAEEMLIKPIAPHLGTPTAFVLPSDSVVELEVHTTHQATLSIDGQVEVPLKDGDVVQAKRSPYVTRLIRSEWPGSFYGTLMHKLSRPE